MRRDQGGMAMLIDAMAFLIVMTLLAAMLMAPSIAAPRDDISGEVRSYHRVLFGMTLDIGDGSSMTRLDVRSYIVLMAERQGELVTPSFIIAIEQVLRELADHYGHAWWVVSIGEEFFTFGDPPVPIAGDVHADRVDLIEGTCCTLYVA